VRSHECQDGTVRGGHHSTDQTLRVAAAAAPVAVNRTVPPQTAVERRSEVANTRTPQYFQRPVTAAGRRGRTGTGPTPLMLAYATVSAPSWWRPLGAGGSHGRSPHAPGSQARPAFTQPLRGLRSEPCGGSARTAPASPTCSPPNAGTHYLGCPEAPDAHRRPPTSRSRSTPTCLTRLRSLANEDTTRAIQQYLSRNAPTPFATRSWPRAGSRTSGETGEAA
jgi:hypothetical protein